MKSRWQLTAAGSRLALSVWYHAQWKTAHPRTCGYPKLDSELKGREGTKLVRYGREGKGRSVHLEEVGKRDECHQNTLCETFWELTNMRKKIKNTYGKIEQSQWNDFSREETLWTQPWYWLQSHGYRVSVRHGGDESLSQRNRIEVSEPSFTMMLTPFSTAAIKGTSLFQQVVWE